MPSGSGHTGRWCSCLFRVLSTSCLSSSIGYCESLVLNSYSLVWSTSTFRGMCFSRSCL
ncbi:hypothetical protein PF005_g19061 [Phytophthora fragariae]|uniref:Uncharacterized protein n=1 Tax=Phytophthora fragariae TaxID=53985 RepID=A0A6A3R5J8_9STRA|nr:hypothetical protein PF009_g20012 [Phytophthora fragariae]KAE9006450.1 hypothetical protein PF011_g11577 [Phytophthora fragariae]KAE9090440.1 hypothetical protein PF007_g19239 [Phytophthora fragariae]KAE9105603.1 hypothetical protein PF006_g21602 [Phytophthora fragariae]KAE9190906.1 hypothetical protein PF005_g19061 [Phytophthora fragariae]